MRAHDGQNVHIWGNLFLSIKHRVKAVVKMFRQILMCNLPDVVTFLTSSPFLITSISLRSAAVMIKLHISLLSRPESKSYQNILLDGSCQDEWCDVTSVSAFSKQASESSKHCKSPPNLWNKERWLPKSWNKLCILTTKHFQRAIGSAHYVLLKKKHGIPESDMSCCSGPRF